MCVWGYPAFQLKKNSKPFFLPFVCAIFFFKPLSYLFFIINCLFCSYFLQFFFALVAVCFHTFYFAFLLSVHLSAPLRLFSAFYHIFLVSPTDTVFTLAGHGLICFLIVASFACIALCFAFLHHLLWTFFAFYAPFIHLFQLSFYV